jgi:hypothetical protein
MGAFNHRYAQPSNQSYPSFGHLFPFADEELPDPFGEGSDGLLKRLKASGSVPKVIYTNSSAEYWRGDASLAHTDPEGRRDVDGDANTRSYHFAGTQHGAGSLPQARAVGGEKERGRHAYNVVDYSSLLRAALVNLERWVVDGVAPPASAHAEVESETAVAQAVVLDVFDRLPEMMTPDRSKLWVIKSMDLGARAGEGVGVYPSVEGSTYPCLVSAVDADGNEVAGVRLPDLTRPVATHAGWNVRDPETGSPEQQILMLGFSNWFAATREERSVAEDPRLSLEERYGSREEYAELVRRDAEALVRDGYVLSEDIELVVQNAVDRYDVAVSRVPAVSI